MSHDDFASQAVDELAGRLAGVADDIWSYAELGFAERRSSERLAAELEAEGFAVTRGAAGMPTAFIAEYSVAEYSVAEKSAGPVVAILGEYDALPSLSQKAATAERSEREPGGAGHGCGHNLLGAGSLGAALAAKRAMERFRLPGRLRYYGCPAEENGSGKTFMARAGLFDDVDAALCWHPHDMDAAFSLKTLANKAAYFRFMGKAAHAAAAPHRGRSALDAVELMNVGANYLREHIIPDARIHYALSDPGGKAPNVVQDRAEVFYFVRAPETAQVEEVYARLADVARGAALMTGTRCEFDFGACLSGYLPNRTLTDLLHAKLAALGAPRFDEADAALAAGIRATFEPMDLEAARAQLVGMLGPALAKALDGKALCDLVIPCAYPASVLPGSTDVGDVSRVTPTAQILCACVALGTAPHSWQYTAQAASGLGHKGMARAAKAMAQAALAILADPALAAAARSELSASTGPYACPLPAGMTPETLRKSYV